MATAVFFSLSLLDWGALTWAMTGLNNLFISSNTLSGFYTETESAGKGKQIFKTGPSDANWSSPCRERVWKHWERSAHLGQLVESDCFLKQTLVLSLYSHFTDDGSGVTCKFIYDSRLERGGEKRRMSVLQSWSPDEWLTKLKLMVCFQKLNMRNIQQCGGFMYLTSRQWKGKVLHE